MDEVIKENLLDEVDNRLKNWRSTLKDNYYGLRLTMKQSVLSMIRDEHRRLGENMDVYCLRTIKTINQNYKNFVFLNRLFFDRLRVLSGTETGRECG